MNTFNISVTILLAVIASVAYSKRPPNQSDSSGIRYGKIAGEGLGGQIKNDGRYPYVVHYEAHFPGEYSNCGATLINPKILLTAAHCLYLYKKESKKLIPATKIKNIVAGSYTLDGQDAVTNQVESIVVHEDYNHAAVSSDMALLFLKTAFKVSKFVAPIKLLKALPDVHKKKPIRILGWGATERNKNVCNELRYVDVRLATEYECPNKRLDPEHICLIGKSGETSDSGDSGGPSVLLGSKPSKDQLVGFVSFGKADQASSVHVSLPAIRDWLKKILNTKGYKINSSGEVVKKGLFG